MPGGAQIRNSLTVSGSAAHMHSRDYIEIINVIYKDEHNGCCRKDHKSPDSGEGEPISRKTWMVHKNSDLKTKPDRQRFGQSATTSRYKKKLERLETFDSGSDKSERLVLPDIYDGRLHSGSKTTLRNDVTSGKLSKGRGQKTSSKSDLHDSSKPQKTCSCEDGLVYLKKTHEWQALLGEYRQEILKLREALKEREASAASQKRGKFKRCTTIEQKDNVNELFREYRTNSYQLLRMRMEERIRHEHKVFEKLCQKKNMHIDSSETNVAFISNMDETSPSPSPPSVTSDDAAQNWHDVTFKTEKYKFSSKRPPMSKIRGHHNRNSESASPTSPVFPTRPSHLPRPTSKKTDRYIPPEPRSNVNLIPRVNSANKKPQRAVIRKRVVRCPCLKHH